MTSAHSSAACEASAILWTPPMKKPDDQLATKDEGRRTKDDERLPTSVVRPSSFVLRLRSLMWSVPLGWQLCTLYTLLLVVTLSLVGSVVYSQQESFLVQ